MRTDTYVFSFEKIAIIKRQYMVNVDHFFYLDASNLVKLSAGAGRPSIYPW